MMHSRRSDVGFVQQFVHKMKNDKPRQKVDICGGIFILSSSVKRFDRA